MRSATSYFNGALYRKTLARFWPLWAGYGVIWLFFIPLSMLNTYFSRCMSSEPQRRLLISAVIHRFGRVGGWTLYGVWMVFMLGQSFLPWKEHWWTAPWLYPAVWVLVLAALAWSVRTLLRVTVKA